MECPPHAILVLKLCVGRPLERDFRHKHAHTDPHPQTHTHTHTHRSQKIHTHSTQVLVDFPPQALADFGLQTLADFCPQALAEVCTPPRRKVAKPTVFENGGQQALAEVSSSSAFSPPFSKPLVFATLHRPGVHTSLMQTPPPGGESAPTGCAHLVDGSPFQRRLPPPKHRWRSLKGLSINQVCTPGRC